MIREILFVKIAAKIVNYLNVLQMKQDVNSTEHENITNGGGLVMKKNILKVVVFDGCEKEFEEYCKDNNIFCKAYPIRILRTRYRAECNIAQLEGAEIFIKSVENMPTFSVS